MRSLVMFYVFHHQDQSVQQYSGPQKVGRGKRQTQEDMTGHAERWPTSDGCRLGRGQVCCWWSQRMEITRRPVFQWEHVKSSLSHAFPLVVVVMERLNI